MTVMTCLSHQRWTMTTSPHLEEKVASSVEGEACLTTMMRYIKLNYFCSTYSLELHAMQTVGGSQNLICAVLCYAIQGDLFSEAPKPPVSEQKKVDETRKSTAQAAGKTDFLGKCAKTYRYRNTEIKWTSRWAHNFSFSI